MIQKLIEQFEAIAKPRDACKIERRLIDILVIAVCAIIGEAESFEDMADYGRCKQGWLKQFLALPNGIPSHDTFRRVFLLIDPKSFERSFLSWVQSVFTPGEPEPDQARQVEPAPRVAARRKKASSPSSSSGFTRGSATSERCTGYTGSTTATSMTWTSRVPTFLRWCGGTRPGAEPLRRPLA